MSNNKPNTGFWIISVLALLWNAFGVLQLLSMTLLAEAAKEAMPVELVAIVEGLPGWYNYVFALAVFMGLLGSIMLLVKKRLAIPLFGISLLAVLIQMGYWLFGTSVMEVEGAAAAVMPVIVIAVSIFLYYYSKGAAQKGWLR